MRGFFKTDSSLSSCDIDTIPSVTSTTKGSHKARAIDVFPKIDGVVTEFF